MFIDHQTGKNHVVLLVEWWCHQMETFSALLAICAGNSPVSGEFPTQRPVRRSFDVFFDPHLNKRLSKQWWGWWFETQIIYYDVIVMGSFRHYTAGDHIWKSSFDLVVGQWDLFLHGDSQQYSKYGYITHRRLFCSHTKYTCTKLGHTVMIL